jgi:hypothetical protein
VRSRRTSATAWRPTLVRRSHPRSSGQNIALSLKRAEKKPVPGSVGYDTEVVIAAGVASIGRRGAGRRRVGANGRYVPDEGQQSARGLRFARGPIGETRLQFVERIADAYGLVLLLILATFVLTVTLPAEGWPGRVAAIAFAGATAVIALTSSNARLVRVRLASGPH